MIYLDHNATTPIRPEALEALREASGPRYANPSSLHGPGRAARALLEDCRERIAARLGARAPEVVFTSGGTEANRLAILGALAPGAPSASHAVVSAIDHPSTIDLYRQLEAERGLRVSWVGAGAAGVVDPAAFLAAIRPET